MQIFTEGNVFGTLCFFVGFFLVLFRGWAWLGMPIEIFGFVNTFKYPFFNLGLTLSGVSSRLC
jgi:hypothetical protein